MNRKEDKAVILIVDDLLENLYILSHLLVKQGYEVRGVKNGQDAIDSINADQPDLILLDIGLPDMDGFEVCTHLKKNPVNIDIPVIFISAFNKTDDILHGFSVGGVDYITKPFIAEEVIARVHTQLVMSRMRIKLKQEVNVFEQKSKAAIEKAQESDRLKSAFLANINHEIRTPMNGILGFAELLKESKLNGEEQQEYISNIERSGSRMLNTIKNLIDISTIETGQLSLSFSDTSINEQIDQIYALFKPEVERKGISFISHKSLPLEKDICFTDREKLTAILINLIKNALKYSNEGKIEFGYKLNKNQLQFFVKDEGIGIPYDMQETIFNQFVQADSSLSSKYQGSGLGLSITKAYVEMIGGEIWLESKEGVGSAFYFEIPFNGKAVNKPFNLNSAERTIQFKSISA